MSTDIRNYIIGCNYWDSENGADMWLRYNPQVIDDDLRRLSEYGVKYLRCFPNWRDFQPVEKQITINGMTRDYCWSDDRIPPDLSYVDPEMLEHFGYLCETAEKYGIKLIVSVMTGWMSGKLFAPPALINKNVITDPEALMLSAKFITRFVGFVKKYPAVYCYDLGNECNCMGKTSCHEEAYTWTAFITAHIRAADNSRMVLSGMHGLTVRDGRGWFIEDQAEITDMLTTHPYSSPSLGSDAEPMNQPRTTILPTAQTCFYADIGGKGAMMEEQGLISPSLANLDIAGQFAKVNLFSGLANGSQGYLWWIAMEHLHIRHTPYTWSMTGRTHGIFDSDKNPKPVAHSIKNFSKLLERLPFDILPDRKREAVCVLPGNVQWEAGAVSFILAKQAGFDIRFRYYEQTIPEAPIYLLPSISGTAPISADKYEYLIERVRNYGAVLYISADGGHLTSFEQVTGLRSYGVRKSGRRQNAEFSLACGDLNLDYLCKMELLAQPISENAEVLAKNAEGNAVFTRHRLGKGYVYLLGFALESWLWSRNLLFCDHDLPAYYRIYSEIASEALCKRLVRSSNPHLGLTEHPTESGAIVIAVNYWDEEEPTELIVQNGYKLTPVQGSCDFIPACDGAIYIVEKEK